MRLYNLYSKDILEKKLGQEKVPRYVLSFYRYVKIEAPAELRGPLYKKLFSLNVLGRIYIASEGINAQISVPHDQHKNLRSLIDSFDFLKGVDFNFSPSSASAFKNDPHAFLKLKIKCRKRIVNDGLDFEVNENQNSHIDQQGRFLTPQEFNQAMSDKNSITIDLRNHYESEVGHFKDAVLLESETYREGLKNLPERLKGKENNPVLLYCTGGIRCEKASVYLKQQGFQDVSQLKGGIVAYLREVKKNNLSSEFIGKNFVFDERRGEKISSDVISSCHLCGKPCDQHTNCENKECHVLMLQCSDCSEQYKGCCSEECFEITQLPESIQKIIRKGKKNSRHALMASKKENSYVQN